MTTKAIVFQHIHSTKGKVDLQTLTKEVLQNDPSSKWDNSHWSFYRTQITSERGRYTHLFSDEIKRNLEQSKGRKVERDSLPIQGISKQGITDTARPQNKWPEWSTPTDEEQIILARTLFPYIRILDPEIVALVVEDNNKNFLYWTDQFEKLGIKSSIYLWANSPVAFPGIRRHVGAAETFTFRSNPKHSKSENALCLDDNSYPKEIWSFALRNTRYGMRNPEDYSLAHILDYKDHKSRNTSELNGVTLSEDKNLFAGLYTSCANTVYIPTTFLKPTDHNSQIRQLLIQIVDKYYGPVCQALPHKLSFNLDNVKDQWRLENFPQPAIVGKAGHVKRFLNYRNSVIAEKITNWRN